MVKKSLGLKVFLLPLAIVVTLFISIMYIKPAFSDMLKNRSAVNRANAELSELKAQETKLATLKNEWNQLEDKALILEALPDSDNIDNYISELYSRVSRSGSLITSFSVSKSTDNVSQYDCQAAPAITSEPVAADSGADSLGGLNEGAAIQAASPAPCIEAKAVNISVKGNWEQIVNLFKYLEDTNRIANISTVSISGGSGAVDQGSGNDVLNIGITLQVFFKNKSTTVNSSVMSGLAARGSFDKQAISKIKEIIYAPYEEPMVAESGERNIFK